MKKIILSTTLTLKLVRTNIKILTFFICLICFSNSSIAQQFKQFNDSTANTKSITTSYFKAYMDLDFDAMKKWMHKDISFEDPTSKYIFGSSKHVGKENVYQNFKNDYSSIIEVKKNNIESFFSSNTGVFKFNISWSYKDANNNIVDIKNLPIIVVLTVENNKVIKHVDYGDYNLFISQITQQNK